MKEFLGPHFYDVRNQHKEIGPVSKSGRETSTDLPDNFCHESVSLESQYEMPSVSGQGFSGERLNYGQEFCEKERRGKGQCISLFLLRDSVLNLKCMGCGGRWTSAECDILAMST